jgi:hypothetical protein
MGRAARCDRRFLGLHGTEVPSSLLCRPVLHGQMEDLRLVPVGTQLAHPSSGGSSACTGFSGR